MSLIPADLMLNIRALTRDYHRIVDTRTVFLNQLTKELALVFPGYSSVFSNTVGKTSRAILRTFKTPKMILEAPKYKVIEFISSHARRGKEAGDFKGTKISMSKRGSTIARRVLFTVAIAAVRRNNKGEAINPVIREYYEKKLISKAKKSAIGAIMRKMTNIIFAVLRDNKGYEMRTPQQHIEKYNKITLKLVA